MDTAGLVRLPSAYNRIEADLREVDVAIKMVTTGVAVRIRLVGLNAPDDIAPIALARAQQAGIDFRVERDGMTTRFAFGPDSAELPRPQR